MKLTNEEILNVREPLKVISAMVLPVKTALAFVHLARKLNEFAIPAEIVRVGLIKQYGKPSEGNPEQCEIQPGDPNWEKFVTEFRILMAEEVEVVFVKPVIPTTLEIAPAILMPLEKFVKIA